MLAHTILYRLIDKGEKIPSDLAQTSYEFVDDVVLHMEKQGLLKTSHNHLAATDKGLALREKARALYSDMLEFESFAFVNLNVELDDEISENGVLVDDDCYDPRFMQPENEEEAEELGTEDLRLALFDCFAKRFKVPLTLERIVYLQMLGDGLFDDEEVWFKLKMGQPFAEIDKIVAQSFPWKTLGEKVSEASDVLESIYTAGMMEHLKRKGQECEHCGIPLAIFAIHEARQKKGLKECPNPDCQKKVVVEDETLVVNYDPFDMESVRIRFRIFED
jgi:hypothetical protein